MTEEQLIGIWIIDPVQATRLAAVQYHYAKHGAEVGATDLEHYVRLAIRFRSGIRRSIGPGKLIIGRTPGVRGWRKSGRFIHLAPNDEIVSFGATR